MEGKQRDTSNKPASPVTANASYSVQFLLPRSIPENPAPGTKKREPAECGLPCAGRRAPSRLAQATVRLAGLEVVLPEDSDVEAGVGAALHLAILLFRNPVGHDGNLQAELVGLAEQEVHAGGDGQA